MAELRRHHPEFYPPEEPQPKRKVKKSSAKSSRKVDAPSPDADKMAAFNEDVGALVDDGVDLEMLETASARSPVSAFVRGEFGVTNMTSFYSPGDRAAFCSEILPLRDALILEFGSEKMSDVMLAEVAAISFFEARKLSIRASLAENVRTAELIDRMGQRAHGRFLGAIELLRRSKAGAVKIDVERVERLHVGDQVIALGEQDGT